MKKLYLILLFLSLTVLTFSQTKEVPFTLDDRDRIIRTEERLEALSDKFDTEFNSVDAKINSLRNEMNTRFEAMETRFESQQLQLNDIKTLFYWGFSIIITLIIFMLGYMIWDRKTALNPVREKTFSLSNRTEKLENALIELSRTDMKLADVLRTFGIL